MSKTTVQVRVQGEFACFTRPESKIERLTYPIATPSAARGILEAIYWHPEFHWRVEQIKALKPVRTYSLLRNEVNSKMSLTADALYADQDRTQRFAVCLRDVDYVIRAEVVPMPGTDPAPKHKDIFERRVRRGQCYHRPCLGTREFAAEFGPAEDVPNAQQEWDEDLGLMLWDLDFDRGSPPYYPLFFQARVNRGVMQVPAFPIGREP